MLLTLGTAITLLYRPSAPLAPALKSTWLVIHVSAAIISGGVFLLANAIAGAYLILDRYEQKGVRPIWAQKLPTLEVLDNLSYRLVALVFPIWTFAVIAGAIWAESAWGRYWGWDPKETWAFITWVAYAAYLHARVTVGWRGRKAAWLCLFAGSTFLFNYIYINVWELVATHILAYNFLKKSGSSSGGIIRPRPPRFCPGFLGLPAINQPIAPNDPRNKIINSHPHFGKRLTFSWGVTAQSIKAKILIIAASTTRYLSMCLVYT